MFSRMVDWREAVQESYDSSDPEWSFVGVDSYSEKQKEDDPDVGFPMMNFAYPVFGNINDDAIKKICRETNCTVVFNNHEDRFYLALTGGGMDLSQDIAKAYILAQGYIEWDFIDAVYISAPLSVSEYWYRKILRELKRQFKIKSENASYEHERISAILKERATKHDTRKA